MMSKLDALNDNHTSMSFSALSVSGISKKHEGVPKDWATGTTKDLIYYMTSGLSRRLVEHDIGIPVLISGNIQNNKLVVDDLKYWYSNDPQGAKIENYVLNDGDILLCFINSLAQIGKPCIYRDIGRPAIYTTNLFRIIVDNSCDGRFAYYLFCTESFQKDLQLIAKTAVNQASFTKPDFLNINICYPSNIREQTAIANALSDVDALIQELEKLIAKKQAIKTATMQQLLTGRTRLPQFAHHPDGRKKGYKPSELGEIPEDWEVLSLGTASSFSNGRAYALHEWETAGTPVIRLQNLTGRGEDYYYSNMQLPERQYCQEGDLLFMWSATFGPVIWKGPKAIYHYHIWKIICNSGFSQAFMLHLLDDMTEKLKSGSSSGGTMLHVTKHKMETTKAVFPVFHEQAAIGKLLDDMDEEIRALENRLNKTRQIKQGMMQELLTGKTRLVKPGGAA